MMIVTGLLVLPVLVAVTCTSGRTSRPGSSASFHSAEALTSTPSTSGGGLTTTRTVTETCTVRPSLTVPVISPPGLSAAATTRNSRVTESPGSRPVPVPQVTDFVPPGQNTVPPTASSWCTGPDRLSSGAPAKRAGPDGIAVTASGKAGGAGTGPGRPPPGVGPGVRRAAGGAAAPGRPEAPARAPPAPAASTPPATAALAAAR